MGADSEPVVPGRSGSAGGAPALGSVKALLALFVLFLVVVSGTFFEHVVSPLGGGQLEPSQGGRVLQGLFLVLAYAGIVALIGAGVL